MTERELGLRSHCAEAETKGWIGSLSFIESKREKITHLHLQWILARKYTFVKIYSLQALSNYIY